MMPDLKESTVCEVRKLGRPGNEKLVSYQLYRLAKEWQAVSVRGAAPKLVAVKQFLSDEEVEEFLAMATSPSPATFAKATQTLRLLDFEETELVKDVEAKPFAKPRESGDSLVTHLLGPAGGHRRSTAEPSGSAWGLQRQECGG